jgi:hypothetical protein
VFSRKPYASCDQCLFLGEEATEVLKFFAIFNAWMAVKAETLVKAKDKTVRFTYFRGRNESRQNTEESRAVKSFCL